MKDKKNIPYIIAIIIAAIVLMLPMFTSTYMNGHDTKFHIANIESITQQFKDYNFNTKIVGNIANNFGYGTGLFYPPLPHVLASTLNLITNNSIISIELVYFVGLLVSGLTMFYLSKKISSSSDIGLISAIIYMCFPYHLSNIYIRDAQNEAILFAFLPLIISGLYELYKNNDKNKFYKLFISGYVFSMLSHLTMTLYFTLLIIPFLIYKYKDTIKNIKPLIVSSILILLTTSFFWVPLVEQRLLGNFRVFQDGVMVQGTADNGIVVLDYINLFIDWKNNEIKFFVDAITMIFLFIAILKIKKVENKFYRYILIFGTISMILSLKQFPWDILPKSLRMFQFPWRFESFFALAVSLLAPIAISSYQDKKVISFIVCIALVLLAQPLLHPFSNEKIDLSNIDYSFGTGWQEEYLPVKVYDNHEYYSSRSHNISGNNASINVKNDSIKNFEFTIKTDDVVTLELPRIYYIGYTLKDESGKTYEISESKYGFIETKLENGSYTLKYTGTRIDKICNILSIFGLLGYIVVSYKKES